VAVALAAAILVALQRGDGGDPPAAGGAHTAQVVRVVDGDTIVVRLGGREERVRYIGVDTPESVKPQTPIQCFAERASAFNARLVEGRTVRLEQDVDARDRYGRLLAYVRANGVFVNAELVRRGYARPLTVPPNVRYAGRFARLASQARAAGTGLWSACSS
jgi:micrococcal nuclease